MQTLLMIIFFPLFAYLVLIGFICLVGTVLKHGAPWLFVLLLICAFVPMMAVVLVVGLFCLGIVQFLYQLSK
jgi:hypothetical protein